jgi:hypothetical protein
MANPYDSHPIYWLRRCLLVLAVFSFILGALACSLAGYNAPIWAFHLLWTFCSALWCIHDLVQYAMAKARNPDQEPSWPSKKVMTGDVVLTVLFGLWWFFEVANNDGYYSSSTLLAYGSVTAMCYW